MADDQKTKRVLRKPIFVKVKDLQPSTKGHNLYLKVINVEAAMEKKRGDGTTLTISEALVGDSTGCILLTVRNEQAQVVKKGASIIARNSKIEMFHDHMRLAVDKWGLIESSPQALAEDVDTTNNLSDMEYELVQVQD